jgi:iron complex transport system ATP-binding protein
MTASLTDSSAAAEAPPAIVVEKLVCGYDGAEVLHGVSLTVGVGQFFGLVGPNGSGKTTLLRALAGIVRPSGGAISILGRALGALSPRALARTVAVVPQVSEATFAFTVEEIVAMGRHPHLGRLQSQSPSDRAAIEQALRVTGLSEMRDRLVTEISGGERQMAVIARALAQQASVLLLDEATSQLDLAHQRDVLALLLHLNRERQTTMVMVSHDLNLAAAHCDTMAVLAGGRLHRVGPPADIVTAETIAEVYHVEAHVAPHPVTGDPYLYVLPRQGRRV